MLLIQPEPGGKGFQQVQFKESSFPEHRAEQEMVENL